MNEDNNPSYEGIKNIEKFNRYMDDLIKEYGFYTVDNYYEDLKQDYIQKYESEKNE